MKLIKTYDFKGIKGIKLGWSLMGPPLMTTYCYMIGDVMVDTGQSHMQAAVVDIAGDHRIGRIFLTHHHEDHSGNAAVLQKTMGVIVSGHDLTIEKMARPFNILPYQKYVWGKARPLKMTGLEKNIETCMGPMTPVHTPGHSKDHLVYYLKDQGILLSGDLYLADRIKFFRSDEDMGAQIDSLKIVLTLEFDLLLCGHHPKQTRGRQRIEAKLAFLQDLYGNIIRLWEKGVPERIIFKTLCLKEDYFTKYFCFGNVSMLNGVRSAIRHHEMGKNTLR